MRTLVLLLAAGFGWGQAQPEPAPAPAPPPATDIYLLPLPAGLDSLKSAKPAPLSVAPGYDNQPMFSADGARVLFAANRDGKQSDVYQFDRASGRISQLTRTPENENSPTFLPPGVRPMGGFSVVQTEADRSQRLWRFDAAGKNPELLLGSVKPVGYHAWVEPDHLAMFILGQPATLQVARLATGTAQVVASDIGRSLHRVPGTRSVSFTQRESATVHWIRQIDIDSRLIAPLVQTVEGSSDRDYAWMPNGKTILMPAGTKVFAWTRGTSGWREVFDGSPHQLGAITRLAVSPKGDAVAMVTAEPRRP
ncbi:MAG: TolB family protein [Vicinamibacterales bacterium]